MEKDSSDSLVSSGEESNEHSDVDAVHYSDKTFSDDDVHVLPDLEQEETVKLSECGSKITSYFSMKLEYATKPKIVGKESFARRIIQRKFVTQQNMWMKLSLTGL